MEAFKCNDNYPPASVWTVKDLENLVAAMAFIQTVAEPRYLNKASFISALTALFPWIRLVVGRKAVLED